MIKCIVYTVYGTFVHSTNSILRLMFQHIVYVEETAVYEL